MNELVSPHWDKVQVQSNGVSVLGTYAPCRAMVCQCWRPMLHAELPSSIAACSSLWDQSLIMLSRPSSHGFILYIRLEKNILYFKDLQFVKADLDFKSCHKIVVVV